MSCSSLYRRWRIAPAGFLFAAGHAAAADPVAAPGLGIAQMVLGLAFVLGLIVLASWLLRRFGGGTAVPGSLVRVVTATSVGPRERIVLVEVRDTWLVLGVTPGRINALHQLPRQPIPEQDRQPQGFARWLEQARTHRQPPTRGASA